MKSWKVHFAYVQTLGATSTHLYLHIQEYMMLITPAVIYVIDVLLVVLLGFNCLKKPQYHVLLNGVV